MCVHALTHPHGGRIIGAPPGVTGSCLLPYKDAHQTWALWETSTLNHGAISPAPSQPFKTDLMYQLNVSEQNGKERSPIVIAMLNPECMVSTLIASRFTGTQGRIWFSPHNQTVIPH